MGASAAWAAFDLFLAAVNDRRASRSSCCTEKMQCSGTYPPGRGERCELGSSISAARHSAACACCLEVGGRADSGRRMLCCCSRWRRQDSLLHYSSLAFSADRRQRPLLPPRTNPLRGTSSAHRWRVLEGPALACPALPVLAPPVIHSLPFPKRSNIWMTCPLSGVCRSRSSSAAQSQRRQSPHPHSRRGP